MCFFAHSVDELRPLPPGLPPAELCWGTGASTRSAAQRFTAASVGVVLEGGAWAAAGNAAAAAAHQAYGYAPGPGMGVVYGGGGMAGAHALLPDGIQGAGAAALQMQPGGFYAQQAAMLPSAMLGGAAAAAGAGIAYGAEGAVYWQAPPGSAPAIVANGVTAAAGLSAAAAAGMLLGGGVGQAAVPVSGYGDAGDVAKGLPAAPQQAAAAPATSVVPHLQLHQYQAAALAVVQQPPLQQQQHTAFPAAQFPQQAPTQGAVFYTRA